MLFLCAKLKKTFKENSMDFDDKKQESEKIVEFFKTAEDRKKLCNNIITLGMNKTEFTMQYDLEQLAIAQLVVLEGILSELKAQTRIQKETLAEIKQRNEEERKTQQSTLGDFDEDDYQNRIDTWIDGV